MGFIHHLITGGAHIVWFKQFKSQEPAQDQMPVMYEDLQVKGVWRSATR